MKLYFYKLTVDDGGAPCVQEGLLSLAICKPMIRSSAEIGDLIFGFAADSLNRDNRLIYIARVTGKLCDGEYYKDKRFAGREDCVYEWRGYRLSWRHRAVHHGPKDVVHDLGTRPRYERANVLLSKDFRYFGGDGTAEYKRHFPRVKEAVERLGQGHRVRHKDRHLEVQLLRLRDDVWTSTRKMVTGSRTSNLRNGVSHRSKSCGVLET